MVAGSDNHPLCVRAVGPTSTPPLFTQRILLVGTDGRPFSAMMGAAVGDVEPVTTLSFRFEVITSATSSRGFRGS